MGESTSSTEWNIVADPNPLTLITFISTARILLKMITPTRTRLICLERDAMSMPGVPRAPSNGSNDSKYARTCAIASPYDAEAVVEDGGDKRLIAD